MTQRGLVSFYGEHMYHDPDLSSRVAIVASLYHRINQTNILSTVRAFYILTYFKGKCFRFYKIPSRILVVSQLSNQMNCIHRQNLNQHL